MLYNVIRCYIISYDYELINNTSIFVFENINPYKTVSKTIFPTSSTLVLESTIFIKSVTILWTEPKLFLKYDLKYINHINHIKYVNNL